MNEFQQEIYKTIDILTEEKLKQLGFDKTKRGKVISVNSTTCIVEIDGDDYTCKLRKGIYIQPNDIVFVKFPQNNNVDKYVDTVLGSNEIPEYLVILAEEILEKLKTVDGEGSGLDADMLDGKHGSEYATKEDIVDISMDGDTIVQNINSSTAIIDDKNLSANVLDKYTKNEMDTRLTNKVDKVEGKGLSTEDYTTIEKIKLSSIEDGAEKNKVNSVNNKTGNVVINKVDINLGDVENKSSATIRSEITKANVTNALDYTPENSSNKGVANGYAPLDSNIKIPLAMLPDIAKQQTYVVETITDRDNLTGLIMGEKCYITTLGDSYIWNGTKWVTLAKADWENVNLQWTNIIGKPQSNVADIDDATSKRHTHSNKSTIDTITQTLIDRWNSAWNHISDAIRHITSAERTKWNTVDNKADTTYVDAELNKKQDKLGYTPLKEIPIASSTLLGGIKVGANLSIAEDGTLNAVDDDSKSTFIIKQETFIATEGQTIFNLTKGHYQPNTNTISVYLYGGKQPNIALNEISSSSFEITEPLKAGDVVLVEYIELSSATPYPIHGSDHLTGGYDPIPKATTSIDGLMAKEDKAKVHSHSGNDTSHYHSTDRNRANHTGTQPSSTISDFASTVRNTVLTGLSTATNAAITATDTVLSALGKLQKQISDNLSTLTNHIGNKSNPHNTTKSHVGLGNVDNTSDLDKPISTATQTALDNKSDKGHKHTKNEITDFPTSLPADGGNADTVDGKHYSDIINYVDTSIGDIEIGGRNLISSLPINWQQGSFEGGSLAINNSYKARTLITDIEVSPNTQYTINLKDGYEVWIPELNENKTGVLNTRANFIGPTTFITTASTKYLYLSLRKTGTSYDSTNPEDFISPSDVPDINIKLEKGNKATDWTPAPEDVQAEIDSKVDNSRVLTDVPLNAKFTDTIYTHPSTHPASMITESTTKRFVSDTEKANWNGKADISDIPTKVGQLENDKNYVTQAELGNAGYGDMVKCYNVDTDILTDRGFINITQLNKQDKVATLNPSNDEIVYQPVKNIYKYSNIDKLYEISNQQIDLSVTLNHKMYIKKRGKDYFELVEAKDIIGKRVEYKKDGIWKCDYKPYVEIEDVKIPIKIYAEFMGYYLSEGCTINAVNGRGAKDYLICITQVKPKTKEKMFKVTEQVAFLFGRNAFVNNSKNIKISDKRLYNHLHPFGKSYEKYIPDIIMNSTQEVIRIFLEAYIDGDGNRKNDCNRKTEQWSIFTTSKKMADQLQELALKAGWSANISEINKIGDISYINGRKVISKHICYRIGFNKKKNTSMVNHGHVKKQNAQSEGIVKYGGSVIGVEVAKYHTLYVRRNGKAVWSGNSIYDKDNDGVVDVAETVIGNEIQLGNYKLIYNETTNSLDIEVIA